MKEINGFQRTAEYMVDREFVEKLIALTNRSTRPMTDIFNPSKKKKIRVIIDYDPDDCKVKFNYYEEETD